MQRANRHIRGIDLTNLNSSTVAMGKLFSEDYFFTIPNYQRPFRWDRDQIADLIDDLLEASKENDYFLGTLVLHQKSDGTFDVVDGQQRLTALSILLACIRDNLENDADEIQAYLVQPEKKFQGIPSRLRITMRESSAYQKIVGVMGGTKDLVSDEPLLTNAEQRYRAAIAVFQERLTGLAQGDLRELIQFIIQKVVVIYLSAPLFEDAFRLFTVVNDRGRQLRRVDILKARNLSPSVITDEVVREEYSRKWEALEESMGEDAFESLLQALRLIYVQEKPVGDLLDEFDKRIFGKPGRPAMGVKFIDELSSFVDLYDALFVSRDFLQDTDDNAAFKTLMYSMVREFRASEWRACLLAYGRRFMTDRILDFVYELELLFVTHWVSGVRKDERYGAYTDILKAITAKTATAQSVIDSVVGDLKEVQDACRTSNFYGAGYSKYLLVRAEMQTAELLAPREFEPRSVEHVYPQNPKAGGQWAALFADDDSKALVHTVGNLVLLSKGKNSSAQNKEFSEKKTTYLTPRVSDFPRSVETLSRAAWTPSTVQENTDAFADNVLKRL